MTLNIRRHLPTVIALVPAAAIVLLLFAPLGYWTLGVFQRTDPPVVPPWDIFSSVILHTLGISAATSIGAVLLGGSVALVHVFSSRMIQQVITLAMIIPLLVGYLARNYAWLGFLQKIADGDRDFFLAALGYFLSYSASGVTLVMTTVFVPLAYFLLRLGLTGIRVETLGAAQTLGCSPSRTIWAVVASMIWPRLLVALLLCFVLALGYFVTPKMIGGGRYSFVGNELLRVLSNPGDIVSGSVIALGLFGVSMVPTLVIALIVYKRRDLILRR